MSRGSQHCARLLTCNSKCQAYMPAHAALYSSTENQPDKGEQQSARMGMQWLFISCPFSKRACTSASNERGMPSRASCSCSSPPRMVMKLRTGARKHSGACRRVVGALGELRQDAPAGRTSVIASRLSFRWGSSPDIVALGPQVHRHLVQDLWRARQRHVVGQHEDAQLAPGAERSGGHDVLAAHR